MPPHRHLTYVECENYGGIYRQHQRGLMRFATALVGPTDAPDVVSDAVVAVLGSRSFSSIRDHRSYLYRAVLNSAHARHRTGTRRLALEARASRLRSPCGPTASTITELPSTVVNALQHLTSRQRAVVFLVYWEDLTPEAAATRLGISSGSVKKHLARARSHLREALTDGPD